jgi:hypothetical protein
LNSIDLPDLGLTTKLFRTDAYEHTHNPLSTSLTSYLAVALTGIGGTEVSEKSTPLPQLLAGLVNAQGAGPVSHLTSTVDQLLAILAEGVVPAGLTYFVNSDPAIGDDSNDGRSAATPWKTLPKVAASTFQPNDVIGFCGGKTFAGSLIIPSSGSTLAKIRFTSYGIGRAIVAPGAANTSAPVDHEFYTVDGIDFDRTGATGAASHGIHITATATGTTTASMMPPVVWLLL